MSHPTRAPSRTQITAIGSSGAIDAGSWCTLNEHVRNAVEGGPPKTSPPRRMRIQSLACVRDLALGGVLPITSAVGDSSPRRLSSPALCRASSGGGEDRGQATPHRSLAKQGISDVL